MTDHQLKNILLAFGINNKIAEVTQIHKSAWDIDNYYILKKNDNKEEVEKSILLSKSLLSMQIPVAEYQITQSGEMILTSEGAYFCLMKKIQGEHLDPFTGDAENNGKMLGRVVARLHTALMRLSMNINIHEADFIKELSDWIMPEIEKSHISFDDGVIEACFQFGELYQTLPRQLIHRDMHLGNLLFHHGAFSGYIDFDISQRNVRLFDICYLGASMLVGNYSDENRLRLWKEIFAGVLEGYKEIQTLTENEKAAIPIMFVLIEVIFTAFFSKINQHDTVQTCIEMTNWLYRNMDFIGVTLPENSLEIH